MDVDKLFKLPKISQSSVNKRKWKEPDLATFKAARVEEEDEEEAENGTKAGPSRVQDFPDDGDDGYVFDEDEDDEGGRFFGDGLTVQQKRILELMNQDETQNEEVKPEQELKKMRRSLLRLERSITKNQEMRIKYPNDPEKFMESETDLNDSIHSLINITTNPALLYPEIVKQNTASSLCNLLTHENVDIVAAIIELLEEMFDDDVLDAGLEARTEEEQNDDLIGQRRGQVAVEAVLESLLQQSFIDLLVDTMSRFESSEGKETSNNISAAALANSESDASAIFHLLGLIENLISLQPTLADRFFSSKLFDWLLNKVSSTKDSYNQNKGYAAELICIILQAGTISDDRLKQCGKRGGIEKLLESLAPLRKRKEEREFVENLFDALCVALTLSENKIRFQKEEGVELMCLIMKPFNGISKGFVRLRALKVIKYATNGIQGTENCKKFIECQGLKYLLNAFGNQNSTFQDEENVLEIVMNLLNNLNSDSEERIRLISKFVEKDYEKLDRLVEVHFTTKERVEHLGESEEEDDDEEEKYLRKLEGGLFTLQLADYALAWLIMEDDGIQSHVKTVFDRRGSDLNDLIKVLQEYHANVGEEVLIAEPDLRLIDVLVQLVNYLLAVA